MSSQQQLNICFLHPDLGIGGAERLIIDAAVGLKSYGHTISMFTSHHDKTHCFEETINGQLGDIHVRGDFFPRQTFGKLHIFWASVRMLYLTLCICFCKKRYDVFFCDQISLAVPLLKFFFKSSKVCFYCHFPDKYLSKPGGILKKVYRRFWDSFEEKTTKKADLIFVNSKFTSHVFSQAFPSIQTTPLVVYPSINFSKYDEDFDPSQFTQHFPRNLEEKQVILSVNRFERKKDILLALSSFAELKKMNVPQSLHLVIAGGYDNRVNENREYLKELKTAAYDLGIDISLSFVLNFNAHERNYLFQLARVLVYTPENEHFGIVPVEAMYCGLPVVASNTGGPLESIKNNVTGLLCNNTPLAFAKALHTIITEKGLRQKMGKAGRKRAKRMFSLDAMANTLNEHILNLVYK